MPYNSHSIQALLNYPSGSTSPRSLIIPTEFAHYPGGELFVQADLKLGKQRVLVLANPEMLKVSRIYDLLLELND